MKKDTSAITHDVYGKLQYVRKAAGKITGKQPAVIFLHGSGTRGTDINVLMNLTFFQQSSRIGSAGSPFVVYAPLCSRNTWFDIFEQLQAFVKMVAESPEVDKDRLYLIGTSMGGYAAWQLAMTMPEYFAALVAICGGGMRWTAKRLVNVPVWAFHGMDDRTVPPEESVHMVEGVKKAGGNAKLTLLENTTHNCWEYAYAQQELVDWLLTQEKHDRHIDEDTEYADNLRFG